MREIIPSRLWLGNVADARNWEQIASVGIDAVVDLALEEKTPSVPRGIVYCRFPILDGAGGRREILSTAVQTVAALLKTEIPTLVCCGAGMSRSPAVAAAALSIVFGGSPDDQLARVVLGHPHDISPHLWMELKGLLSEMRQD